MVSNPPIFNQVNLTVKDMAVTLAFYRRLGFVINGADDDIHAAVIFGNGISIEFDTAELVKQYDSHPKTEAAGGILGFSLDSREAVDRLYAEMIAAGYQGHQSPYDAFWGARYAIIDDPDGNAIGLMSPVDKQYKYWPPKLPPSGL